MCQPLTKVPSISMSNFAKMITLRTHTTYTIVWFGSYKRWRFQVVVKYTGLVTLSIYILVFYRDRTCFVRLNLLTDFSIYLLKRRGLMKERALQLFFFNSGIEFARNVLDCEWKRRLLGRMVGVVPMYTNVWQWSSITSKTMPFQRNVHRF